MQSSSRSDSRRLEADTVPATAEFFLPDLCRVQSVLLMVLATELVALLFTLIHSGLGRFDWDYLALSSLFGQWVVLSCAAILCLLRPRLARLPLKLAATACYGIVLGVTLVFATGSDWFFGSHELGGYQPNLAFIFHCLLISAILTGLVLRYFYLDYRWREQQQAELQARLQALQARIRPHFLFNSMNTIASLIATDPIKAEDAVLDLAEVFRATLKQASSLVSLRQELDLCRRYLQIEQLRLGERLQVEWKVEPASEQVQVPPIFLQPLVENAVYHGIQPRSQGGTVTIESYLRNGFLYVLISNPQAPEDAGQHQGNRMALSNIRSRLEAIYGEKAVLKASVSQGRYTATLRFPARLGGQRA